MRFDLCTACTYFQAKLLTLEKASPKCCTCPRLLEWFGESVGGFP